MKPILFPSDAQTFLTNGEGRMSDAITCKVTEERNGAYELEMEYPVNGAHFSSLEKRKILLAIHDDKGDKQPFRIYEITKPLSGIVKVRARHISYDLNKIVVKPFTATSCSDALSRLKTESSTTNPFTFWTDKAVNAEYKVIKPSACRSLLGGSEGSILDIFGTGEYEWDNWTIKLYLHRGIDTDVTIRYGKNLTQLEDVTDISGVYSAVYPFWYSEEAGLVELPEKIVYASLNGVTLPVEVAPLDLTGEFESAPTQEQLRTKASTYLSSNKPWEESHNLTVSFAALWQTEEYKNIAVLERLSLCDTVTVVHNQLGIKSTMQIVKTVYDVLAERYYSMDLGSTAKSFTSSLQSDISTKLNQALSGVVKQTQLDAAIDHATDLLRGGLGGYVITVTNANGQPIELLVVDNPDLSSATKVWRWNVNGLGYSSNGYNGPYRTAITMDGHVVADFVDTGTLTANIIKAGILSDAGGNTVLNMSTGELTAKLLSIQSPNFTLTQNGDLTANNASLSNVNATGSLTSSDSWGSVKINNSGIYFYGINSSLSTNELLRVDSVSGTRLYDDLEIYTINGNTRTSILCYNVAHDIYSTPFGNLDEGLGVKSMAVSDHIGFVTDYAYTPSTSTLYYTDTIEISGGKWDNGGNLLEIDGGLYVTGTKNRVVETEHYDRLSLNAMESTYCVFSDLGSGEIGEDGKAFVFIDPDFLETIDDKHQYQVFLTNTKNDSPLHVLKEGCYFVVSGLPYTTFDWIIYARQKQYTEYRLEHATRNRKTDYVAKNYRSGPSYDYTELENLAWDYLDEYEREVDPW